MYKIKEKPEDFVVEEVNGLNENEIIKPNDPELNTDKLKGNQYLYFWMTKKDLTTVQAVEKITKAFRLRERSVGFAGNKDKLGVTTQVISIKDSHQQFKAQKIEEISTEKLKFKYIGRGKKPVSLGNLNANKFKIIIS